MYVRSYQLLILCVITPLLIYQNINQQMHGYACSLRICFNNIALTIQLTLVHPTEFINAFVSINALHGSLYKHSEDVHYLNNNYNTQFSEVNCIVNMMC